MKSTKAMIDRIGRLIGDRIDGLSDSHKQDLLFTICCNILRDPLIVGCCQTAFCKQCINEWMRDNPNCPVSKHPLDANNFNLPSRILQNILKSLRISCDNKEKGCEVMVPLDGLERHLRVCQYTVVACDECSKSQCLRHLGHQCIKEVNQHMNELREENGAMSGRNDFINPIVDETNLSAKEQEIVVRIIREEVIGGVTFQTIAARIIDRLRDYEDWKAIHWRCSTFLCRPDNNHFLDHKKYISVSYGHIIYNIYQR